MRLLLISVIQSVLLLLVVSCTFLKLYAHGGEPFSRSLDFLSRNPYQLVVVGLWYQLWCSHAVVAVYHQELPLL